MTTVSIPVDLFNPGQVFACLGLVELAEVLVGPTRGGFDWNNPDGERFVLHVEGHANPLEEVFGFLDTAEISSLTPNEEELSTEKWKIPTIKVENGIYPTPVPNSPASLPAILKGRGGSYSLHSWGEVNDGFTLATSRDNVKFWAGAGGYPGVAFLRDSLDLVRPITPEMREDPFSVAAAQSSSFRFDWRRDYLPLEIGFSLNNHTGMAPQGYPLVEILAAAGLNHARPQRLAKLRYRYSVTGLPEGASAPEGLIPAQILRAALGNTALPFPTRTFIMELDWPGQEGQARCIKSVQEESNHDQ